MANLNNFTKVLALFCVLIFFYIFSPKNLILVNNILTFFVIVTLITVLVLYSKILEKLDNSEIADNNSDANKDSKVPQNLDTNLLYKDLKILILNLIESLNPKLKSAFYMLNPSKQVFQIQVENSEEFAEEISVNNPFLVNYLPGEKRFHQKDYPEIWDELFPNKQFSGAECAFFTPVYLQGSIAGFLINRVNHFGDYSDNEMNILNKFSKIISFNLQNLSRLDLSVLAEKNKMLILDIIDNLDFKAESQNIFNQFKYLIRTFFKYDRLTISIRKESENRRKIDRGLSSIIKLTDGLEDKFVESSEFPTNGSIHGLPIINGEIINTIDWAKTFPNMSRFKSSEEPNHQYNSVIGAPIIIDGESRGSIFLERLQKKPFLSNDEKDLELVGKILGSALFWKSEYEKIHINATHDGLSGLLNHQTFKERFSVEILRAARFQQKMAVMIFDLDKFKKVNDTLGHQYGDYVIQSVAKIMQDNVRAVDVVARYGGEEFAIILINSDADMSNIVAQRIVDNIADFNFNMDGVKTSITISGGMSEYPTHSDNTKDLIELADQAMYATKQNGGNGIMTYKVENIEK